VSAIIIDNGLIHYEALGRGKPLIFLHGWLGSWRYWMPTMEALSDRYRTYAFDLWGFGDSDRRGQHYAVDAYAVLLDQFMEQLGIVRASLVGHALGAAVAIVSATKWPDRFDRIMAVSTPLAGNAITKRLLTSGGNSLLDRVLGRRGATDYPEVETEATKTDPAAVASSAHSLMSFELRQNFDQIEIPLLLVYGDRDPFVSPLQAEDLNGVDDNVRPIGLDDSGHFPMLDEASKFQRLLRDFLEIRSSELGDLALKAEWRRRMH
jgi:pimeloyl-ACP methyl ester carboxylesterase